MILASRVARDQPSDSSGDDALEQTAQAGNEPADREDARPGGGIVAGRLPAQGVPLGAPLSGIRAARAGAGGASRSRSK